MTDPVFVLSETPTLATEAATARAAESAAQTVADAAQADATAAGSAATAAQGAAVAAQATANAAVPQSVVTTKGDLIVATGPGVLARRGVGGDGQVLTADSTQADGVGWATPATGGGGAPIPTNYLAPAGAAYETFPRHSNPINSSISTGTGLLYLCAIALPVGFSIGWLYFATAGGSLNMTHWWLGLYDRNRVQLATTQDQTTTSLAGNAVNFASIAKTAAGPASTFTTTYTGLHYIGFSMTASSTGPQLACGNGSHSGIFGAAPPLCGSSNSALTTPPAFPFTAAPISPSTGLVYAYVGP
jgi:hypothetical protein